MADDTEANGTTFVEEPQRIVCVRAICGCGQGGELKSLGGGASTIEASKWVHQCTKCRATVSLEKSYPRIEYRDVEPK